MRFYGVGFVRDGEEKNRTENIFTNGSRLMSSDTFNYCDIKKFASKKEAKKFAKQMQKQSVNPKGKKFVVYKY